MLSSRFSPSLFLGRRGNTELLTRREHKIFFCPMSVDPEMEYFVTYSVVNEPGLRIPLTRLAGLPISE